DIVFDQTQATRYYLQAHPEDLTNVILFNSDVAAGPWTVTGNDPDQFKKLDADIHARSPDDGTNMYRCLDQAVQLFQQQKGENRRRLIIVMTDGQSETDRAAESKQAVVALGNVPVISVAFGSDADKSQLMELANLTGGTVVDQANLVDALREAT